MTDDEKRWRRKELIEDALAFMVYQDLCDWLWKAKGKPGGYTGRYLRDFTSQVERAEQLQRDLEELMS